MKLTKFFMLLVTMLPLYGQQTNNSDNIDILVYRGTTGVIMPQLSPLPQTDLIWVSVGDKTGTANYMIITMACDGMPNEIKTAAMQVNSIATVVFVRSRYTACNVSVEAVTISSRKSAIIVGP